MAPLFRTHSTCLTRWALRGAGVAIGFLFGTLLTGTPASGEGVPPHSVTVNSDQATGNTATATITVVAPPTMIKAFGATSVPLGGTTSLGFTIIHSNTEVSLTGVSFTDTLPAGLVLATPNGLTGSCGGGVIQATPGSSSIILIGATLPPSGFCTFSVNVTGTAAGVMNNTTSAITSINGGAGNPAFASLTVSAPPTSTATATPTASPTPTATATPPPCILGDINCDGIVDIRDYGIWRQNFGASDCGNPADLDGNCIVDIRDYGIWRQNFGHTAGGAAPGGAPPALVPTGTATPPPARTPRPASAVPTPLGSRTGVGDPEGAADPPDRQPALVASGLLVAGLFWRVHRRRDDQ
jgi:uncharacterized repeat protein (TIGR01451 family)